MGLTYDKFQVKFISLTSIAGGVPLSPDRAKVWVEKILGASQDLLNEVLDQTEEFREENPEISIKDLGNWSGFRRTEKGLYLPFHTLRAWLKEAADTSGLYVATRGQALRQVIENMNISPFYYYLGSEADGASEERGRIKTPDGSKVSIIKFMEIFKPPVVVEFTVHFINNTVKNKSGGTVGRILSPELFKDVCNYAQNVQLGAGRGRGYGKMLLVDIKHLGEVDNAIVDSTWDNVDNQAITTDQLIEMAKKGIKLTEGVPDLVV